MELSMTEIPVSSLDQNNRFDDLRALNVTIHGLSEAFFDRILLHNPASNNPACHRFIELDGNLVSGTSLLRHNIQWYGEIIPAGEIGLVGTLEPYRNRGFSKRLMNSWLETISEENIPFSFLWGIPGFYERFHYYYAYPNHFTPYIVFQRSRTELWESTGSIRNAELSDRWWIQKLYRAYNAGVTGCQVRTGDQWNWYFKVTDGSTFDKHHMWWVPEDPMGGYAFVSAGPSDDILLVREIAAPSRNALKLLVMGLFENYPDIRKLAFFHHPDMPVGKWLYHWGADMRSPEDIWKGSWAGMVRIINLPRLLTCMENTLSSRLANSRFFKTSSPIPIKSESGKALIKISDGQVEIESLDSNARFFIPARVLTPIMTGYQGFDRFRSEVKDIPDDIAEILSVLFPRDIVYMHNLLYIDEGFEY